jgi:very-short-patch-repair endonuclease
MFERRVSNGTWTTWRKNTEPSYPERFFMKVLASNRVPYEYEKPLGRYSIDFAINDRKIALEIDGQQHRFPDRVESDARKDTLLMENGWRVFRIKWKSPRTVNGKQYLKSKIDEFLRLYETTPILLVKSA